MRINCPVCGERDSREFHYRGSAKLMDRPAGDAGEAAQARRTIQIAAQHMHATRAQFAGAGTAGAEHGDLHAPLQLLHDTHADVAATHEQQPGTPETRRQRAHGIHV